VAWKHPDKAVVANWKAQCDYSHSGKLGDYDYRKDPRPINEEYEKAVHEDWDRMGYNCAYKGGYFTFEFFRRINEEATQKMNAAGKPGRISCYPFTQHFIIWPGANQRQGNSFYWYHRLSPVVNVEHMWADAPDLA